MKRVDAEIERIFDTLKNSGLLDDTVILMTCNIIQFFSILMIMINVNF